ASCCSGKLNTVTEHGDGAAQISWRMFQFKMRLCVTDPFSAQKPKSFSKLEIEHSNFDLLFRILAIGDSELLRCQKLIRDSLCQSRLNPSWLTLVDGVDWFAIFVVKDNSIADVAYWLSQIVLEG